MRFQWAVARTCEGLVDMPSRGRQFARGSQSLRSYRFVLVESFPRYLVIYRDNGSLIEIVRVLHGARDIAVLFE